MILFITNPMSQQRPLSMKAAEHVAYAFCFALFIYLLIHIPFSSSSVSRTSPICIVCLSHKYLLDRLYPLAEF